jgi:DNA modification methylase
MSSYGRNGDVLGVGNGSGGVVLMELNKIYNEPCLKTMARMDDKSINSIITSPPYWQLRDYGHPDQWGLEPTFNEYLEHLWQFMDEAYRVLKSDGTTWVNLGDTYARGSRGKGGTEHTASGRQNNKAEPISKPIYNNLDKCLLLIPHRFAIGCIDRGWIVRNDIIWAKPNGRPESVTDRFTKKHEYIFFMVKQKKYYFDLDASREPISQISKDRYLRGNSELNKYAAGEGLPAMTQADTMSQPRSNISNQSQITKDLFNNSPTDKRIIKSHSDYGNHLGLSDKSTIGSEYPNGKNPGDVADFWAITTKPNSDKHYASYNDELLKKPVLSGCPKDGIIYDPFIGTGSTGEVALRAGRNFIGSETTPEYCDIADKNTSIILNQTKLF